jgi:hypothetical protein
MGMQVGSEKRKGAGLDLFPRKPVSRFLGLTGRLQLTTRKVKTAQEEAALSIVPHPVR